MNESNSSGDAYEDVVKSMEEHYRKLFNAAYADACSYAHVLATLHHLRRGLAKDAEVNAEVTELERWFNRELDERHGRERPRSDADTDTGAA